MTAERYNRKILVIKAVVAFYEVMGEKHEEIQSE
jgi:hypothetical protein